MNFNNRLIIANNVDYQNNIIDEIHNNIDIYDILQFNILMELIIKLIKALKKFFNKLLLK